MTVIEYSADALIVNVTGWDKVWALKSQLTIAKEHVISAEPAIDVARAWFHGFRLPGTSVPGVITAGTFYKDGNRVFWDVHNPNNAIAIHLRDDKYAELVVEVEDPTTTIALINRYAPHGAVV